MYSLLHAHHHILSKKHGAIVKVSVHMLSLAILHGASIHAIVITFLTRNIIGFTIT